MNGKSLLDVLTLAASLGTVLHIVTDGPDEGPAADALEQLVLGRFQEER